MGGHIELMAEQSIDPAAIVLLAPAANTDDLKCLFGGADAWEAMRHTAETEGFCTYTTICGQVQHLGALFFSDLDIYADCAQDAASMWNRDALVIFGSDDEAVSPERVSEVVAGKLNATVVVKIGEGHGYGFYSADDDTVRNLVASATADFLAAHLD